MSRFPFAPIALALAGVVLTLMERRWPASRRRSLFTRSRARELAYWLLGMTIVRSIIATSTVLAVVFIARALGAPRDGEGIQAWLGTHSFLRALPRPLQVVATLLAADFGAYWLHRLMHGPRALWKVHAVHHATEDLDWFSAARVHPLGEIINSALMAAALIAAGFDPRLLEVTSPAFGLYAIFLHANVRFRFGALRFVIATPAFHRWHHAVETPRGPCNFAAMFPIWDLLFGTYYVPARSPEQLGAGEPEMPRTVLGELLFPFRRHRRPLRT